MSMQWNRLLCRNRLGTDQLADSTLRTDFQRDFDRIVFASAFRRLQDKTQVFPLSSNDYVRTRLTHSLEASCLGRSLGTLVGEQVIARHNLKDYEASDFGDICAAACLGHDIGNPPFGHSGEDAFRHWACEADYGQRRVAIMGGSQRDDFLHFEGNAQGFRILSRLQNPDNHGGLQLTCATLAAFTKYPRESYLGGSNFSGVSAKKQGFVAEDRELFKAVAEATGLIRRDPVHAIWARHPLAFLVEAADDISYRVIDIEDGYRLGYLTFDEVAELYGAVLQLPPSQQDRLDALRSNKEKVEFLRAKVINEVIGQTVSSFLDNEVGLLSGEFDQPLLDMLPKSGELEQLIQVARERIYSVPEVVEIQAAGFQVIGELLECFIQVLDDVAEKGDKATAKSRMMIRLIPEQFVGPNRTPFPNAYTRLLRLTDYISGMTDSYAVSLYKQITGISLPGG